MRLPVVVVLPALALASALAAAEPCPGEAAIRERLARLMPERGARTVQFGVAPPVELYERAAHEIDRSVVRREGKTVQGVRITARPIEILWKALNDEPHHAIDDGAYVPVRHSEVVEGTPRGPSRLLFQYFKKAGIGRWWVSRVEMSPELFRASEGALWELRWHDVIDSVDATRPPYNSVSLDTAPLERSYGAWLLVPLAPSCTLVEYFNHTEPGGFVSLAQALLAKSAVRDTLDGIVRLADEHLSEPHPDAVFVRPDGTPLD
jgi:hypothetical protein